jgi:pantoate--beta-alanine ligase
VDLLQTPQELQARADQERAAGKRIALVPTMGALHEAHLQLVDAARERADRVVVSIFVNPSQFNAAADLEAYPRTLEADLAACRGRGVDLVYAPEVAALYPNGHQTWVTVSELEKPLCGASRPGHFRGVATVVCKLLTAAKPHLAVFGEKDFQQLAVLRRMVRDLGFDVEVLGVPTVREPSGLALSSRNVHLGPEARNQAVCLVRALEAAESAARAGETRRDALLERAREEVAKSPLARVDYLELRDSESLAPASERLGGPTLLALAATFPSRDGGEVRLIDNRVLPVQPGQEESS